MPNSSINNILWTAYEKGRTIIPFGDVATYIPELGKANKGALGITLLTKDGRVYEMGDTDTRFTIQSISKVISLTVALELFGIRNIFDLVGMELNVIAAVVLGGARITGGYGTVTGTLLGVFVITMINTTLLMAGVPSYWQKVVIGGLIIVGTGLPIVIERLSRHRERISRSLSA